MLLERLQRLDAVMGEHHRHLAFADLLAKLLQDERFEVGLVIDKQDGRSHAAGPSLVSISWHETESVIGPVRNPSAPRSSGLRRVGALPSAVIMITGTSGRLARACGSLCRPLMPGMLTSDRISEGSWISRARASAAGPDGANSI